MATRKNPKVSLPKQWTSAQVRVNPQGKVQVKIAKNKVIQNPKKKLRRGPSGQYYSLSGLSGSDLKRAKAANDRAYRMRTRKDRKQRESGRIGYQGID